jgi:hypothetical protein
MAQRTILSLLLVCSILSTLAVPRVISQNAVTSYQTSATSLTSTIYSTTLSSSEASEPIHFFLTPGDYDSRVGSFTLGYTEATNIRYFGDLEDYPCLFYDYFLLNATSGHTIRIHFQLSMVDRRIDLLILNSQQFWSFEHTNCGWGLRSSMLHVFASSSNVDWSVPESGQYALIFATPVFYGGQVYCSAQEYSTIIQSDTTASTVTSVFEVTYPVLFTPTVTQSIITSPTSANVLLNWLPVILILIVGLGIALLLRSRL